MGYTPLFPNGGASGDYNSLSFMMRQHMARMNTSTVVKVMGVTNAGDLSPVGFVDIQPQVDLVDGAGVKVPHITIYKCPYFRLQGGANAIILDPQVGDLGVAMFADRDISSVIANKGQAAPGSGRRFDMADGIYMGGIINGTPTQFVQFSTAGIQVTSPTAIKMDAPDINLTAPTIEFNASTSVTATTPTFTINGALVVSETVSAAEVDAPIVSVATTLTVATKNLGPNHVHSHGTMTSSGQTGTVV